MVSSSYQLWSKSGNFSIWIACRLSSLTRREHPVVPAFLWTLHGLHERFEVLFLEENLGSQFSSKMTRPSCVLRLLPKLRYSGGSTLGSLSSTACLTSLSDKALQRSEVAHLFFVGAAFNFRNPGSFPWFKSFRSCIVSVFLSSSVSSVFSETFSLGLLDR